MRIVVKEDFRNLKDGSVYDLSMIDKSGTLCVVGDNGCGKSTLFQALRGYKNDMVTGSLHESDFKKLSTNILVEHNYDRIFYFDSVKDSGSDIGVSYDAVEFIKSGGYATRYKSHGESSLIYISEFINKVKPLTSGKGRNLIVLDEPDKGFGLSLLSKMDAILVNLHSNTGADIICITHNPFLISDSQFVYDFQNRELVNSDKYLLEKTGHIIIKK